MSCSQTCRVLDLTFPSYLGHCWFRIKSNLSYNVSMNIFPTLFFTQKANKLFHNVLYVRRNSIYCQNYNQNVLLLRYTPA